VPCPAFPQTLQLLKHPHPPSDEGAEGQPQAQTRDKIQKPHILRHEGEGGRAERCQSRVLGGRCPAIVCQLAAGCRCKDTVEDPRTRALCVCFPWVGRRGGGLTQGGQKKDRGKTSKVAPRHQTYVSLRAWAGSSARTCPSRPHFFHLLLSVPSPSFDHNLLHFHGLYRSRDPQGCPSRHDVH